MIKKFFEFLNSSNITLGQEIESLLGGGDISPEQKRHIMESMVKKALAGWESRHGKNIDANIRLANAIDNVIDDSDREDLKSALRSYISAGVAEKNPAVSASAEQANESVLGGKGVYHSFLKALTALGQKDAQVEREGCPDDFLLFQVFKGLDSVSVSQVFARFRSLDHCLGEATSGEISLYMGITCDGYMEYGMCGAQRSPFGRFSIGKSSFGWLSGLESKSLSAMKQELKELDHAGLMLLGKAKTDMAEYTPGNFDGEKASWLRQGVLCFGYRGVGRWDNGRLDQGELENLKSNFVTWLLGKKWSDRVLISVRPGNLWVYIYVKPK